MHSQRWQDLERYFVSDGSPIRVSGRMYGTPIEQTEPPAYHFLLAPAREEQTDGSPVLSVRFAGQLDDERVRKLMAACENRAPGTVEGTYRSEQHGRTIGIIEATALEF